MLIKFQREMAFGSVPNARACKIFTWQIAETSPWLPLEARDSSGKLACYLENGKPPVTSVGHLCILHSSAHRVIKGGCSKLRSSPEPTLIGALPCPQPVRLNSIPIATLCCT